MNADIFTLNAHAEYACRHSGACCTAGWTIPVEAHLLPVVGADWLEPGSDGACSRYDRTDGCCDLHRGHGESMLPVSCYQFPRRALIDDRGISVALSLFCPTAASLLLDSAEPLRIERQPRAFPRERAYEGLDARDEWPPLLRPDVLFDPSSFTLWEQHLVESLSGSTGTVHDALIDLAWRGEHLRAWTAASGSLDAWARQQLAHTEPPADGTAVLARYKDYVGDAAFTRVLDAVPPGLSFPVAPDRLEALDARWVGPGWGGVAPKVLRVLGAKAFASWTAYQSRGVRTQIAELFTTASVLRVECVRACAAAQRPLDGQLLHDAVRQMDRLLVHLVDRDLLLPWLGQAELDDHATPRRR